jgi:thioester reductase-like protein
MSGQVVFFTGAGGFIGRYLLSHFLKREECDLFLLEHEACLERLRAHVDARVADPAARARIRIIEGDIRKPGLGMEPGIADELRETMTCALHLAAVYDLMVPRSLAQTANVDGTRNVLDLLASAKRLRRFGYASTCAVSGTFEGHFHENDFDVGQGFKNHYEESKYQAEELVRERMGEIPSVILRPAYVVGNSRTGGFESIDGPYFGLVVIERGMHRVLPDLSRAKCHAVPVDYVADAFYHLLEDERSVGSVFHLADPAPLSWSAYMDLACERWGAGRTLLKVPPLLFQPLLRFPPFARLSGLPYTVYQYACNAVEYGTSGTIPALAEHGVACPPLPSYIDTMIAYYKAHSRERATRSTKRRAQWPTTV